ncbi:TlpA family protein disulfide reductase [bacterium]|nr:TlpA family protein disulfide reductase [bacterium]
MTDIDSRGLASRVGEFRGGKAVLVNIWATWCAPCVEEFPDLVKLQRDHAGSLQVLFVSADFDDQRPGVVSFLEKQGVDWETFFKTENDQDFIPAVWPEWSGALPATLLYDKNGRVVEFWEGAPERGEIESAVRELLTETWKE